MSEAVKSALTDGQALLAAGIGQLIAILSLFRRDNVRTDATRQIAQMIGSIKRHGYKPNHPLVVSKKPDGTFLVLCGNRRMEAIETILANEPETFAKLFPTGEVPCIVYSDLTDGQEAILRIDHSEDEDRVPLDDWGYFLAIRQLVRAGYDSQADIAAKIGWFKKDSKTGEMVPNRSKVQQRVNLCQLPTFVQAEFEKFVTLGAGASNVRWSDVATLFKEFNADYKAGFTGGDGPAFKAAWDECRQAPEARLVGVKPVTPADMEKRSKVVGSANLRNVLAVCAGKTDKVTLNELDAVMVQAETAVAVLAEIADYLGPADFSSLTTEAHDAAVAKIAGKANDAESSESDDDAVDADLAAIAG